MRSLLVHGILAVAGLVLAWRVWADRNAPEVSADAVTLLECGQGRLQSLELDLETKRVAMSVEGRGDEAVYRFEAQQKRTEDAPDTAPPEPLEPKRFLGSRDDVEAYVDEKLSPLRAIRSLGVPEGALLEEIALDEPEGRLTLRCGERDTVYDIGGAAFGSGDRYVREAGDDVVYLVAADVVRELQSADFRMIQRDLHAFDWTEVASVTAAVDGAEKTLLQRDRLDARKAQWVDEAEPDRRNELFDNWMDRVKRLRVQTYLPPDAAPGSDLEGDEAEGLGAPVAALRLVYRDAEGAELGRLALERVDGSGAQWFYAESDATRGWVTVMRSVATQVEDDGRLVLGLDPVERPEDRPTAAAPDGGADEDGAAEPDEPAAPEGGAETSDEERSAVPATGG